MLCTTLLADKDAYAMISTTIRRAREVLAFKWGVPGIAYEETGPCPFTRDYATCLRSSIR